MLLWYVASVLGRILDNNVCLVGVPRIFRSVCFDGETHIRSGYAVLKWPFKPYRPMDWASCVRLDVFRSSGYYHCYHIRHCVKSVSWCAIICESLFFSMRCIITDFLTKWVVLVLYGIAGTLFAYCMSLLVTTPLAAFALVAGYQVVMFVVSTLFCFVVVCFQTHFHASCISLDTS